MHRPDQHQANIDGFRFAKAEGSISGTVSVSKLPRLAEMLREPVAEVAYSLTGTRDSLGRLALRLTAQCSLPLTCQRCLDAMELPLSVDSILVLARGEREIQARQDDPDGPDWVVGGEAMPVLEMVEEELLLSLPYIPRHEKCVGGGKPRETDVSPAFTSLRGLLVGSGRHNKDH